MTYATPAGRTFLDRGLYLPKGWTEDRDRCTDAGIGVDVDFATKPEQAMVMLERAVTNKVPARWVTADEVYGQHFLLRVKIEELHLSYVLAVPVNQHVIAAGPREGREFRADELIAALPGRAWRRRSGGEGSKGDRLYDWARTPIHGINFPDSHYRLLARRSIADPTDMAYYLCHAPGRTGLTALVTVAGTRWSVEETFQTGKGQTGLDHYQVRQYSGWYRHITLSMLAHAFLTVTRSRRGPRTRQRHPHRPHRPRNSATADLLDLDRTTESRRHTH